MISYDLLKPGRNYQPLWDELKRLGAKPVLRSQWVMRSASSAYDLVNHLVKYIDANDKMIANELNSNIAWYNTGDITKVA
jgi:hypothetical protein